MPTIHHHLGVLHVRSLRIGVAEGRRAKKKEKKLAAGMGGAGRLYRASKQHSLGAHLFLPCVWHSRAFWMPARDNNMAPLVA